MKIEIEKPVIPQFVADWIESLYDEGGSEYTAIGIMLGFTSKHDKPVHDWFVYNKDAFINAVMFGYEVEQEPLYYARMKGSNLVMDDIYTYWSKALGVSKLGLGCKQHEDVLVKTKMTKEEWNELGINDTNADFEEVE